MKIKPFANEHVRDTVFILSVVKEADFVISEFFRSDKMDCPLVSSLIEDDASYVDCLYFVGDNHQKTIS